MWWRALGVAFVLLCVGVVGGYAVADRTTEAPLRSDSLEPVPAVSPAVPTPPEFELLPDPTAPALQPGLPTHEEEFRTRGRGPGAAVGVPDGWVVNLQPDNDTWTFTPPINTTNTYSVRINLLIGRRQAPDVAKTARIAALESAESNGGIEGLELTEDLDDYFEATYIADGFQRVTMERFVPDGSDTAYVQVAVIGRTVDQEGMRDLVTAISDSARYLEAKPEKEKEDQEG